MKNGNQSHQSGALPQALWLGMSSKALKNNAKYCTESFTEPVQKSWNIQSKPKYSEQVYLDLRPYHEKLPKKLPNWLKSLYKGSQDELKALLSSRQSISVDLKSA